MRYKPDVVQKAKFEYSPLGQVFIKGLDASEKQKGLLKRLNNIEDKIDNQLKGSKDSQLGIKSDTNCHRKQKICLKKLIIKKCLLTICTLKCMEVIKSTMILENLNL